MVIAQEQVAYFQGYLLELKKAYFSGAERVKYRERDTTFRSLDDMKKLIDELEGALNPTQANRSGVAFAEFSTGL